MPPASLPQLAAAVRQVAPEAFRGAVLGFWAAQDRPSATQVGAHLGVSRDVVLGIVRRARQHGDARATLLDPDECRERRHATHVRWQRSA